MGYCLVVATEDGKKENAPCEIGITDDKDQIQNTFDMMVGGDGKPRDLKPVAAFTAMDTRGSYGLKNWLGENIATSLTIDRSANEMIERFDEDMRFSRFEELKERFEEYNSGFPEMPDTLKDSDPRELFDLIEEM